MLFTEDTGNFQSYLRTIDRSQRTIDGYGQELSLFNRHLEGEWNSPVLTDEITTQDVQDYLAHLKEKGYKSSSRRRALNCIRSFYKWAYNHEIVSKNVTLKIEPIKSNIPERCFLTDDEVATFIAAVDAKQKLIKLLLWTLYYTGMRITEALSLTLDDVNLEARVILVQKGKGGKSRRIPINPKLQEMLEDYITNWRPESDVFFALKKTRSLSKNHVARVVRETREQLGWKKQVTPHVFRHSFASNLIKKNVSLPHVSKLLGHSNLAVTSVYVHSSMEDLEESIAAL